MTAELPNSDGELAAHFHSLADTIHLSFNDHIFVIVAGSDSSHSPGIGRQQLMRIPRLEDIITLFGLEREINWKLKGVAQRYSPEYEWHNHGISGNQQPFRGFDNQERLILDGVLRLDSTSDQPSRGLDAEHKSYYGTSLKASIKKYTLGGSEPTFLLGYDGPLDVGSHHPSKFLSYWDEEEQIGIYFTTPSFQLPESSLINRNFVQESYRSRLVSKTQEQDILTLVEQEEKEADNIYNKLRGGLALDKIRWDGQPEEITIVKISELARYLESKYRNNKKGISEFSYKEYAYRVTAFQDYIWQSLGQYNRFDPEKVGNSWRLREKPKKREDIYWGYKGLIDLPKCPNSDEALRRGHCLLTCFSGTCPVGLGPFDPGPHNPSAPNDPRGPDPRGLIDPRGPR